MFNPWAAFDTSGNFVYLKTISLLNTWHHITHGFPHNSLAISFQISFHPHFHLPRSLVLALVRCSPKRIILSVSLCLIFHPYPGNFQIFISNTYVYSEFQTQLSKCLQDISIWVFYRHLQLDTEQSILCSEPALSPMLLISVKGNIVHPVVQASILRFLLDPFL